MKKPKVKEDKNKEQEENQFGFLDPEFDKFELDDIDFSDINTKQDDFWNSW